jgi:large subunit ribosomal protein L22
MSKPSAPRKVDAKSALATAEVLRGSTQKLGLVAGLIRGKTAAQALTTLTYSTRRVAGEVKKVLQSAIANAENNHALDIDRLVVTEASVGKAFTMKRFHVRGRGRGSRILKPFAKLRIVVTEQAPVAKEAKKEAKKPAAKKATTKSTAAKAAKGSKE